MQCGGELLAGLAFEDWDGEVLVSWARGGHLAAVRGRVAEEGVLACS